MTVIRMPAFHDGSPGDTAADNLFSFAHLARGTRELTGAKKLSQRLQSLDDSVNRFSATGAAAQGENTAARIPYRFATGES